MFFHLTHRKWSQWLLLAGFLLGGGALWAQPTPRSFRNYQQANGLPSNFINHISFDRLHRLWVATDKGIACFDGITWRTFTTDHGLPSNLTYQVQQDPDGRIWAGTYKGLAVAPRAGAAFLPVNGLPPGNISALAIDGSGCIYVMLAHNNIPQLLALHPRASQWHALPMPYTFLKGQVLQTWHDGRVLGNVDGRLCWLEATADTLLCRPVEWEPGSKARVASLFRKGQRFLESDTLDALLGVGTDEQGHLCLTAGNAWMLQTAFDAQGRLTLLRHWRISTRRHAVLEAICFDNYALFGSDDGLYWAGNLPDTVARLDWIAPQYINCLAADTSGQLWVGTYGNGLYKSLPARVRHCPLPSERLFRLALGTSGGVWVCGTDALYRIGHEGNISERPIALSGISCLLPQPSGGLLAGTYNRLYALPEWPKPDAPPKPLTAVNSGAGGLAFSPEGTLWVGTYGIGVHPLDTIRHMAANGRVAQVMGWGSFMTESLVGTPSGAVWATSNSEGVFRKQAGEEVVQLRKEDGLPSNYVHAVFEDRQGRTWIGTEKGVACYEDGMVVSAHTAADGLRGLRVVAVFEGKLGRIWALTEQGLHWLENGRWRSLEDLSARIEGQEQFRQACYDADSRLLWAITDRRLYRIDLAGYEPDLRQVPASLWCLEGDGQALPPSGEWPAGTQRVCVSYGLPHFAEEQGNRLRYRLEGWQENWQEADGSPLCFERLPAGRYRLWAKTLGPAGTEGPEQVLASWQIGYFWWQAWWAYLLWAGLLVGAIGGGAYLFSWQRYQRQLRAMELDYQLQAERQRISRELHDHVGGHLSNLLLGLDQSDTGREMPAGSLRLLAKQAMASLREAIWMLYQPGVTAEGLFDRLKGHCLAGPQPPEGFAFDDRLPEGLPPLPPATALHISRLLQEAVQNALKHSHASHIRVSAWATAGWLHWQVSDNGRGMGAEIQHSESYGLRNMAYRAQEIRGKLEWREPEGGGLCVCLSVPCSE
jgi:signal transduction histidine kinase/ligand-binding sensor domain-containing protein